MPMLKELDLSNNKLVLVNSLLKLTTLENINLNNNVISSLPDLSVLKSLETLNLSGNLLEVLPRLKSESLIYIDLSYNKFTSYPELKGCTALKDINITGQTYEAKAMLSKNESYVLEPIPELITQAGDVGTVILADKNDKPVYEESISELKEGNYIIPGDTFDHSGEYTLTVTSYKAGALLAQYSYNLSVEGLNWLPIAAATVGVVIIFSAAIYLIQKNKNKRSKADD